MEGFGPLTLLKHLSMLRWGTGSLLSAIVADTSSGGRPTLWGRKEVSEAARGEEAFNDEQGGVALLVNARAKPDKLLLSLTSRKTPFAAFCDEQLVAARLDAADLKPGVVTDKAAARVAKGVDRLELPREALFEGYWSLIENNGIAVARQAPRFEDPLPLHRGVELRGPRGSLQIHSKAEVEPHVTFDTRLGPVAVDEGATVESFSRVMGPCYIGPRAKVQSALIGGGTSIFASCKVGGQVENSIISPYTNKAHEGYLGDSYVGEWVNLGAGMNFSNLKNTYGSVRVDSGGRKVDTGLLKLGPCVGDMCKVSIGALVYAGRSLGTGSHVSGLARSNVPSFTAFDGWTGRAVELLPDSVVETQRRMMERRGQTLDKKGEELIRSAIRATAAERSSAGVVEGELS